MVLFNHQKLNREGNMKGEQRGGRGKERGQKGGWG